MAFIETLWIGNGAVLKSSSQWQSSKLLKSNNSVHELFIFKILFNFFINLCDSRTFLCDQTLQLKCSLMIRVRLELVSLPILYSVLIYHTAINFCLFIVQL